MIFLNYVSNHNSLRPKLVIGFAAETNNMVAKFKKKINGKKTVIGLLQMMSLINQLVLIQTLMKLQFCIKIKKLMMKNSHMKKKSEIANEIIDRVVTQLN